MYLFDVLDLVTVGCFDARNQELLSASIVFWQDRLGVISTTSLAQRISLNGNLSDDLFRVRSILRSMLLHGTALDPCTAHTDNQNGVLRIKPAFDVAF